MTITKGFYLHYKGGVYFVHGVADMERDEALAEGLVVYESVEATEETPATMRAMTLSEFTGEVARGIPRFRRLTGPKDLAILLYQRAAQQAAAIADEQAAMASKCVADVQRIIDEEGACTGAGSDAAESLAVHQQAEAQALSIARRIRTEVKP